MKKQLKNQISFHLPIKHAKTEMCPICYSEVPTHLIEKHFKKHNKI